MAFPKDIPIVLIIFNRPKETREVLDRIRDWEPQKLYVIADAPRQGNAQDSVRCEAARAVVESGVDWPCKATHIYADENMGCGRRIVSGLDAVFEREDWAIILEDDCVPDPSFFPFAAELLQRYEQTPEIMQICGSTWDLGNLSEGSNASYFFSKFPLCWGWATWKRAWKHMQWDAPDWSKNRNNPACFASFSHEAEKRRMKRHWDALFLRGKNSWAYRWHYVMHKQHGLSIVPVKNLVVNIGCGLGGTHTQSGQVSAHSYACESQTFPLVHPESIAVNKVYDDHYEAQNAHFYARKINWPNIIKGPLRTLKRTLLTLSTRLNPRIWVEWCTRKRALRAALPKTCIPPTSYPSACSIFRTLELIRNKSPKHVLEIGSGPSTLYLAKEVSTLSNPPLITTITDSPEEQNVAERAMDHLLNPKGATCTLAPLEESQYALDDSFWYSSNAVTSALKSRPPVDFLWVHGPVDPNNPTSWPLYTAIAELKPHLAQQATLILCPCNTADAVFLAEALKEHVGMIFRNQYAQYGILIHTP